MITLLKIFTVCWMFGTGVTLPLQCSACMTKDWCFFHKRETIPLDQSPKEHKKSIDIKHNDFHEQKRLVCLHGTAYRRYCYPYIGEVFGSWVHIKSSVDTINLVPKEYVKLVCQGSHINQDVPETTLVSSPVVSNLRLAGGETRAEGRLDLYHDGQWSTLCLDSWDYNTARVICRTLGFDSRYSETITNGYTSRNSVMHLKFLCTGSEATIYQCRTRFDLCEGYIRNRVGVRCSNASSSTLSPMNKSTNIVTSTTPTPTSTTPTTTSTTTTTPTTTSTTPTSTTPTTVSKPTSTTKSTTLTPTTMKLITGTTITTLSATNLTTSSTTPSAVLSHTTPLNTTIRPATSTQIISKQTKTTPAATIQAATTNSKTDTCIDSMPNCDAYGKNVICQFYPSLAKASCKKSCSLCS